MGRLHYQDLEDELNVLRRQYNWWSKLEASTKEEKNSVRTALEDIQTRGENLKKMLAEYECPQLISASENNDDLIADISTLLLDLDDAFNFNNDLSTEQIEQLAWGIADRFGSLTLEDIALCFSNAKQGKYGEVFRLDVAVVYGFINKYKKDRQVLISDYHQNKHILGKSGSVSYDPTNKLQVAWALKDRDINPRDELYYEHHREDYLQQKAVKEQAREKRIERKLKKSKK